jgi:hypothetical protein
MAVRLQMVIRGPVLQLVKLLKQRTHVVYLNICNHALVAQFSPCTISRGGEGVWVYVKDCVVAIVRDIKRGNGDCIRSVIIHL